MIWFYYSCSKDAMQIKKAESHAKHSLVFDEVLL